MPPRTRSAATLTKRVVVDPPAKRQKLNKPATTEIPLTPPIPSLPIPTSPTLLPPTLSFSLPDAIAHLTQVDPRFQSFFTHLPCRPFVHLEAIDPFRTLVTSIIGQQVSWLAARAINNRFRALYGFDPESKEGFPSPSTVSSENVDRLKSVGLSTRKAEYVISLAQHFTSGQLSNELLHHGTDEEISKALIAVRGIGRWTVDMFLMFSLRRPDVLAVGDLGVQKGLLRWALSAHNALPSKPPTTPKKGKGEAKTATPQTTAYPPTPSTPTTNQPPSIGQIPPTPSSPSPILPPAPHTMLVTPIDNPLWDPNIAAPLSDTLTIEVLKSRLAGKKVKGGMYLTPKEMEDLTVNWKPYRSLAVFYMWPAAEES